MHPPVKAKGKVFLKMFNASGLSVFSLFHVFFSFFFCNTRIGARMCFGWIQHFVPKRAAWSIRISVLSVLCKDFKAVCGGSHGQKGLFVEFSVSRNV